MNQHAFNSLEYFSHPGITLYLVYESMKRFCCVDFTVVKYDMNCYLALTLSNMNYRKSSLFIINFLTYLIIGSACDEGWINYNNIKCIKLMQSNEGSDKFRSIQQCMKMDAKLLTIHSREEQLFITLSLGEQQSNSFIGLSRIKYSNGSLSNEFVWDDGSQVTFTNWSPGEPNDLSKECIQIQFSQFIMGEWSHIHCNINRSFICEKSINKNNVTSELNQFIKCSESNQDYIRYGDSCYKIYDINFFDWNKAEQRCQQDHANSHLLSIIDAYEHAFIQYWTRNKLSGKKFWIGLKSYHVSSQVKYQWSDGWPLTYYSWANNKQYNGLGEECVEQYNGAWRVNFHCYDKNAFICKINEKQAPGEEEYSNYICPKMKIDNKQEWVNLYTKSKYCYWHSGDQYLNWRDSQTECSNRDSHLVSPHFDSEKNLLRSFLWTRSVTEYFWIGLSKNNLGDYIWEDRSPLDFANWGVNQSTNVSKSDCVSMHYRYMTWKNNDCYQHKIPFICSIEKVKEKEKKLSKENSILEESVTSINTTCNDGWINYDNKKCIKAMSILDKISNYSLAMNECGKFGAKLLTIHSRDEQLFITFSLREQKLRSFIGLSRKKLDGFFSEEFIWDDGSQVTFTNWFHFEPSQLDEGCVEIIFNKYIVGGWNDVLCDANKGFICEKSIENSTNSQLNLFKNCSEANKDYIQFGDSCYKIYESSLDWNGAESFCQKDNENSHLLSIIDAYEHAFIQYWTKRNMNSTKFWIGLKSYHMSPQVKYQWSDGWPLVYASLADNETDIISGFSEGCVEHQNDGIWKFNIDCNRTNAFICKINRKQAPGEDRYTNAFCPLLQADNTTNKHKWINLYSKSKYCYWHSDDLKLNWHDASNECKKRNATLISIHSEYESLLMSPFLWSRRSAVLFWIGLYRFEHFEWQDESPLDFTNWGNNKPQHQPNLNCVNLYYFSVDWVNDECFKQKLPFICGVEKVGATDDNSTRSQYSSGETIALIVIAVLLIVSVLIVIIIYLYFTRKRIVKKNQQLTASIAMDKRGSKDNYYNYASDNEEQEISEYSEYARYYTSMFNESADSPCGQIYDDTTTEYQKYSNKE